MTGEEIAGIIIASIAGCVILVLWICYLVLMFKDTFKNMPTKKKQIKELQNEVSKLQNKINVLNFQIKNHSGKEVEQTWFGDWTFKYLDNDSIEYASLPDAEEYKLKGNYIVDEKGNKYKYDIKSKILIKIEKTTKKEK